MEDFVIDVSGGVFSFYIDTYLIVSLDYWFVDLQREDMGSSYEEAIVGLKKLLR